LLKKLAKERDEYIHSGISCDGCGAAPIQGIRYKSTTADGFDLCTLCEAGASFKQTHGPFLKVTKPSSTQEEFGGLVVDSDLANYLNTSPWIGGVGGLIFFGQLIAILLAACFAVAIIPFLLDAQTPETSLPQDSGLKIGLGIAGTIFFFCDSGKLVTEENSFGVRASLVKFI
jgi:hypothetical protein